MNLTLGANANLSGQKITLTIMVQGDQQIGDTLGLVWLALNDKQKPVGTPAYLQTPTDWATVERVEKSASDQGASWTLDLSQVPTATDRLRLVLYSYSSKSTLGQVKCDVQVAQDQISYQPQLNGCTDSAMIVVEVYRRNAEWKIRALAEGSPYGLASLGQRLELALDEKHPNASAGQDGHQGGGHQNEQGTWTGTAFAISPTHLLTCAHVVRGATVITIDSLQGKHTVQCVAHDEQNDMAVLKLMDGRLEHVLPLDIKRSGELGEAVTTMGYPLSSMMGHHIQVTQGCISSLRGFNENCGALQFTAPIQPGSSGSPLLDQQGMIVGMVTSSIPSAQNMNFAVKQYLLQAMLDAIGLELPKAPSSFLGLGTSHTQLVKKAQHAIWHVDCSGTVS